MSIKLSNLAKANIKRIITDAVENGVAPAIQFGVGNAEEELLFESARESARDGLLKDLPLNEDSIFWLCSHTKLFVAVAALQLIEAGKLDLDTPVTQFVPELSNLVIIGKDAPKAPQTVMTIRHLMNHTSGLFYDLARAELPHGLPQCYVHRYTKDDPIGTFFKRVQLDHPGVPLMHEPGAECTYGYSMDVLAFIVERISGKSLEQYMKDHIFIPVGLSATTFHRTPELTKKAIPIVFRDQTDKQTLRLNGLDEAGMIEFEADKVNIYLGGIGLHSTVKDNLRFLMHLLRIHAGLPITNPILSRASVQSLFVPTLSPQIAEKLNGSSLLDYINLNDYQDIQWSNALCLNMTDWPGKRRKHSGSWFGWAGTLYFMDPSTGIAVILATQVIPFGDPQVINLFKELEGAVYAGLE